MTERNVIGASITLLDLLTSKHQPLKVIYKTIGSTELTLEVFTPPMSACATRTPAMVFIHGGGWVSGDPALFTFHCRYFASRGATVFNVRYRLAIDNNTIYDGLEDCKSAIRYIREHADDFGIDPEKIVALGDSAGGHLAACLGMIPGFDVPDENTSISTVVNAMVLYNPVVDLSVLPWLLAESRPGLNDTDPAVPGAGISKMERAQFLSPVSHVKKNLPPCLVMHGTADTIVPIEQCERFTDAMKAAGNDCTLIALEGRSHAFILPIIHWGSEESFVYGTRQTDEFLASLGYLKGEPTLVSGETGDTLAPS